MDVKAQIKWGYLWRPGAFAMAMLVASALCFYDGYHAWPRERLIRQTYDQFKQEHREQDWPSYAREHGWPANTDNPGAEHSDTDLILQKAIGFVLLPVGLLFAVGFVRSVGRWIACDAKGITTSWGRHIPFDAVSGIQLNRWTSKGVAVVSYDHKPGKGRLVLDDWKYDRSSIEAIVQQIKQHLGIDGDAANSD